MDTEIIGVQEALTDAQKKANAGDYSGAKDVLESVIKKLEGSERYNDPETEYHTFAAPIEQVLFLKDQEGGKKIEIAPESFATLYLTYSNLLLGMKDNAGAKNAIEKAIEWNPVNPNLRLEYADIFRVEEDMESFFDKTLDAYKTAYSKEFLARIYRNIGFYFIEKEKWHEAMAAYVLSLHIDSNSQDAAREIDYIQEQTQGKTGIPSMDEIKKVAREYGFSTEPNDEIVGVAAYYGHKALDDGRKDVAKYFLTIAENLTGDPNIASILEKIED